MKISNFIVVDQGFKSRSDNKYTLDGEVYIQIGTPVPVIVKGEGCIGLAMISEIRMSATSTTIFFEMTTDVAKEAKKAYYNLYRNQVSTSGGSDFADSYTNTDTIIPGAVSSRGESRSERRRRGRSVDDFFDDIWG